jgi:hypothetical protein
MTQTEVFTDRCAIGWREWTHGGDIYFVQSLPGDGGVDWGYTKNPAEAIDLSPYWQRRFRRDCERVGYEAHFFDR